MNWRQNIKDIDNLDDLDPVELIRGEADTTVVAPSAFFDTFI